MISELGPTVAQVDGILPGRCHDERSGCVARSGGNGAIGVPFAVHPKAPVRANGSYSSTAKALRQTIAAGYTPPAIAMRGRFYASNALGRRKGRSGKGYRYSDCSGDQPFWATHIG